MKSLTRKISGSFSNRSTDILIEIETLPGLEGCVEDEIARRDEYSFSILQTGQGFIRAFYGGSLLELAKLRIVQAVYTVGFHAVPRPKALLGDEALRRIVAQCQQIRDTMREPFTSFFIAAAGDDSSVMVRLRDAIASELRLPVAIDKGDLLLRIMPARNGEGWETLARLTARPLATRYWRTHNFEGALNATAAAAMNALTLPDVTDDYLNLAAGSGSLIIERALEYPAHTLVGLDHDSSMPGLARDHQQAAGKRAAGIRWMMGDLRHLPFASASFNAVTADLPFGQRVGSHANNRTLYPATLDEAARVTRPGGRCVLITHELKLMTEVLSRQHAWQPERTLQITLRGLHPCIYVLRRT